MERSFFSRGAAWSLLLLGAASDALPPPPSASETRPSETVTPSWQREGILTRHSVRTQPSGEARGFLRAAAFLRSTHTSASEPSAAAAADEPRRGLAAAASPSASVSVSAPRSESSALAWRPPRRRPPSVSDEETSCGDGEAACRGRP